MQQAFSSGDSVVDPAPCWDVDLAAYRDAVGSLVGEVAASAAGLDASQVHRWLSAGAVSQLLSAVPGGHAAVERNLTEEIRRYYQHRERASAAHSPAAWLRIYLLSRIDALWWGDAAPFETEADVMEAAGLAETHRLRRTGALHFSYNRLPSGLPGRARARDWAHRRLAPGRRPRTAGLRLTSVRPELLVAMNHLALEFKRVAPPGTPPMWVTSMLRTAQEQRELRALGYPAFTASSHCSGYAFDVEAQWFERFDARSALEELLLDYQRGGAINAVDEGQIWHVCMSPGAVAETRRTNTFPREV